MKQEEEELRNIDDNVRYSQMFLFHLSQLQTLSDANYSIRSWRKECEEKPNVVWPPLSLNITRFGERGTNSWTFGSSEEGRTFDPHEPRSEKGWRGSGVRTDGRGGSQMVMCTRCRGRS